MIIKSNIQHQLKTIRKLIVGEFPILLRKKQFIHNINFSNPKQQLYKNIFTFRNIYNYRSEQKFIDFRKDYYDLLGVSENATIQEIKQMFYHLAKEYHPDRNKGNQTKFKQISQAYNVLSQPNLRKEYDSNRFKEEADQPTDESTLKDEKAGKSTLNYGAYSQMSKASWAVYRSGYMKHSDIDYTNYQRNFDVESDSNMQMKKAEQWKRAFRKITVQQLEEQVRFRQKLYQKYCEDLQAHQKAKQRHIEERLNQIGAKIEKYLGKRIRSIYDKLIQK